VEMEGTLIHGQITEEPSEKLWCEGEKGEVYG